MDRDSTPTDQQDLSISPHSLIECITTLCSAPNILPDDARTLAYEALLPSHHPSIAKISPTLWLKIIKHLKLRPKEFIGQYTNQLRKSLLDSTTQSEVTELSLSTVIRINPDAILPTMIDNVINKLGDVNMLKVTKDDYFIYLTPEGELYDKSVIPGNDESLNAINIKRESKVSKI